MQKIDVAILGATGAVGQRFIQLLQNHPWFQVAEVVASERSAGLAYGEAAKWVLDGYPPADVAQLTVKSTDEVLASPIVFSALPSGTAKELEPKLAQAGHVVCSNASAFRMAEDVPILLPEINAEHLELVNIQRKKRGWSGAIVTNSNCTSTPVSMSLAPLRQFQPDRVLVTSMQAISGGGYPGVASLDIMDNVIPYIGGEEDKLTKEPAKMIGTYQDGAVIPFEMVVSASCNRVPVIDAHLVTVALNFKENPSLDDLHVAWDSFRGNTTVQGLPSAPEQPILIAQHEDRPQPRRDRMAGNGMSTVVGRLRPSPAMDGWQYVALSHNTIRGAAGCSIINAELMVVEGYVDGVRIDAGQGVGMD